MGILDAIGGTSLVALEHVVPDRAARVSAKLEWENPTGCMKDRMARTAIELAEKSGRLKPGDTVVEYTGGSTGTSLALVCAAKGYKLRIVTSDAFSEDKLNHMAALGAELTIVPSEGGRATKKLFCDMIDAARKISEEPNTFWFNQLENADIIPGYHSLGEEIWRQTGGRVDAFVQSVGSMGSARGVASVLKAHDPGVKMFVVEPAESSVLSGGSPGAHGIEGIGIGREPPLYDASIVEGVIPVSTADAEAMARRLAREEGLFAGTSSGANVFAALDVARQLGPNRHVVTLMIDSGLKYLSTGVYRRGPSGRTP